MPCPMNMSKDDIELIQLLQYGKVPYTRGLLDMQKERQRDFLTLKRNCKMMFVYYDNERNIQNSEGHEVCCEIARICDINNIFYYYVPFYMQTWFFVTCGAILLLLIVGVAVGVFFCCRRKRKRGGDNGGGGQSAKGIETGGKKNKK
ncbi:hypothetical protein CRE_22142 [Caenorhabditis remanei]|uniref:Uncharacterized protein n=1 Tax=Caenorhabditis remanei TaxID=31234 RepID=E3NIZ4_CAERE|nr:hypothetical protein CRE_22142 [Caenorhabditis remanei]